ncbi:hypothetical protein ACF0H5_015313 [Mactra antiquata]
MDVKVCLVFLLLSVITTEIAQAAVSTTPCTVGDECDDIEYAECDADPTTPVCKCKDGYKENNEDDSCVAKELTDTCSGDAECSGVEFAVCTGGKCACGDKYAPNKGVCNQVVTDATCADPPGNDVECANIENAECSDANVPICVCKTGATENNGVCELENGAASATAMIGLVFFPLMIILIDKLLM